MGSESKNKEEQRRELNGITYFDRGRITGRDGKQYDRYAIQTHFIEVGEFRFTDADAEFFLTMLAHKD